MEPKEKLEAALRKAKFAWRKVVNSPRSTPSERRRALVDWKKAIAKRDVALVEWRRALAERRQAVADRRKSNAEKQWANAHADRRKMVRRP